MAITEGQAIFTAGIIFLPIFISIILLLLTYLLKESETYKPKGILDYIFQTHMLLRLFFMFISMILITTSLYLAIGFENEYIGSATGGAFEVVAGYSVYVLLFVFIVYWLIWIIYNAMQWQRDVKYGENENQRDY